MDKDIYLKIFYYKEEMSSLFCVCVFVVVVFNDGRGWHGVKETLKNFPCDFGYLNFQDEPKVKFWDSADRIHAFNLSPMFKNFIIMRLDFAKTARHFQFIFLFWKL